MNASWMDTGSALGGRAREWGLKSRPGIRFVDIGVAELRVREVGPPDAPAVVFAADAPVGIEHHDRVLARWPADRRAVVLEMPGFGFSRARRGFDFTVGGFADAAGRALDALQCRAPTLVFPCAWGFVALELARMRPEQISKLVLPQTPSWDDMAKWADRVDRGRVLRRPVVGQLLMKARQTNVAGQWFRAAYPDRALGAAMHSECAEAFAHGGRFPLASLQPKDKVKEVLDGVDAILQQVGGRRERISGSRPTDTATSLCDRSSVDGAEKVLRDYLCEPSTLVSRWLLWNLPGFTGGTDAAVLEVRRFESPEAAWTAKATGVERYGGLEPLDIAKDTVTNGHLQVYWAGDLLFSVQYAYANTPTRTRPIGAVLELLRKSATPFEDTGVVGVDDWSVLLDEPGKRIQIPDHVRFRHFFKVTGVDATDLLRLRAKPTAGRPGEELGRVPAYASCIPRVFDPPLDTHAVYFRDLYDWIVVKLGGKEVWVKRRFLAEQPKEECLRHP